MSKAEQVGKTSLRDAIHVAFLMNQELFLTIQRQRNMLRDAIHDAFLMNQELSKKELQKIIYEHISAVEASVQKKKCSICRLPFEKAVLFADGEKYEGSGVINILTSSLEWTAIDGEKYEGSGVICETCLKTAMALLEGEE